MSIVNISACTFISLDELPALHRIALGMAHVFRLEGGILKDLGQTDASHRQGEGLVFDERGAASTDLLPLGERAGVRSCAVMEPTSRRASIEAPASARPSPHSSPRGGAEANARGALLDGGKA